MKYFFWGFFEGACIAIILVVLTFLGPIREIIGGSFGWLVPLLSVSIVILHIYLRQRPVLPAWQSFVLAAIGALVGPFLTTALSFAFLFSLGGGFPL